MSVSNSVVYNCLCYWENTCSVVLAQKTDYPVHSTIFMSWFNDNSPDICSCLMRNIRDDPYSIQHYSEPATLYYIYVVQYTLTMIILL